MTLVAVIAGDGIGKEIMPEAERVLEILRRSGGLDCRVEHAVVGVDAWRTHGKPLPDVTMALAKQAKAVLFGTAGDPAFDHLGPLRPDAAIGGLRKGLNLYASLREVKIGAEAASLSPLRTERAAGVDIAIVREIAGDVYAASPKGQRIASDGDFAGEPEGFDTMRYAEGEVRRIARLAFAIAQGRGRRLVSADKSNVLETSRLWRRIVDETAAEFPSVSYSHILADNLAMQLIVNPGQFDTILSANLFGDILSDIASVLTGSIGLPASAQFNEKGQALYEPGHGSAPDIAGRNLANPIAAIRCVALMARHSFARADLAEAVEQAIANVLAKGLRTAELCASDQPFLSTQAMGKAIASELKSLL